LVACLGQKEVGEWKWRDMSKEEQYKLVHAAVTSNPEQYAKRLEATNFDKFLSVLTATVGGDQAQE
jgi:hypothetical protein